MDVNGTKFHLLYGKNDWGTCLLSDGAMTLESQWAANKRPPLEWDCAMKGLRLTREVPLFRKQSNQPPLDITTRRGAGQDQHGNWYWIDASEHMLYCLRSGTYQPTPFWSGNSATQPAIPAQPSELTFAPRQVTTSQAMPSLLRGLVVTTHNYLVVGDVTNHGLLLFDLYNPGSPTLQRWPDAVIFAPWDMATTPDGGLLILDREHSLYWTLDCHLRLVAPTSAPQEMSFQSVGSGQQRRRRQSSGNPLSYPLRKEDGVTPLSSAISIEAGPDGHVLILETDVQQSASTIYEYEQAQLLHVYHLADPCNMVEIMDPVVGEGIVDFYAVIGHDMAFIADSTASASPSDCNPCASSTTTQSPGLLYIADYKGKQAFGFRIDATTHNCLNAERTFVPLRHWGARGIASTNGQVYYDFQSSSTSERWVPMVTFAECHYVGQAVISTPTNFVPSPGSTDDTAKMSTSTPATLPAVAGGPFDSVMAGCIWHRLLLDAQIPSGSAITIRARAADDPALLPFINWVQQPNLYLRSGGAELPYYDPWCDLHDAQHPLPELTGTWEILLQQISGRYLQLELSISGAGRSTPTIRALRAWYPRFSYVEHYLPAVYQEDSFWSPFFDRWLANFEGLYTNLEDKIEHAAELFDPRTTPPDNLQWLAGWFALLLDPHWDTQRRRLLIRYIDQLYRRRGTVAGIAIALHLYLDAVVSDCLFDLSRLDTSMGTIRIIEQFLTRDIGDLAYGVPTTSAHMSGGGSNYQRIAQSAHRFIVLVPPDLSEEQMNMAQRIIELEKPVHTAFTLASYQGAFAVGQSRLGQDTRLGQSSLATQQPLGESYLGSTYLDIPYPTNIPNRLVFERDDLGNLSAL